MKKQFIGDDMAIVRFIKITIWSEEVNNKVILEKGTKVNLIGIELDDTMKSGVKAIVNTKTDQHTICASLLTQDK